jgi:hypothetical protein
VESTRNSLNLSEEPAELGEVACGTRGSRGACGACVEVDLEQEVNLAEVEVDLEQGVVLEQGLASMELSTVWISEITFERAVREVVQVSSWQV